MTEQRLEQGVDQDVEQLALALFQRFIHAESVDCDASIPPSLDYRFEAGVFVFTLRGLQQLLDLQGMAFNTFKQSLYASRLNQKLAKLGYAVSNFDTSGKVDNSWYQLAKI